MRRILAAVGVVAAVGCAQAADAWECLPLGQVRVGGEFGRRIGLTVTNNLMKVDLDGVFLKHFTNKVSRSGTYIAAGKMLDAFVAAAKYTGDPDVLARKDYFRDVLVAHQEPDGYMGVMAPGSRMALLWDVHEQGYLLQALVSDAREFGSGKSFAAARKLGDYFIAHWGDLPADWGAKYVGKRLGSLGMPQAMVKLYGLTGERKYLDFAVDTWGLGDWDEPIVLGRDELVCGHVYSYLAFCLGQQELYRLAPDEKYLRATKRAMDMIFNGHAAVVSGEVGLDECWTEDQDGGPGLGETCTGVYQMFNYDSLLRLGVGDGSLYGDAMERTVYNAIFAAQSADGRSIRYYTPLLGERKFFNRDDYCCPTNFRRLAPRLSQYALYRGKNAILANLYTACETTIDVGGTKVGVKETTDYPNDGRVVFDFRLPNDAEFDFVLRLPRWCAAPQVAVNGQAVESLKPGTLAKVRRVWKDGDRLALDLPMTVRCVRGHFKQSGRFAVLRGPVLYALNGETILRKKREPKADNANAFSLQRDKAVLGMNTYEMGNAIRIDPRYLTFSNEPETSFRPNGTKIMTHAATFGCAVGVSQTHDPICTLTEFADPKDVVTYFRMPGVDSSALVEDEIFR